LIGSHSVWTTSRTCKVVEVESASAGCTVVYSATKTVTACSIARKTGQSRITWICSIRTHISAVSSIEIIASAAISTLISIDTVARCAGRITGLACATEGNETN